jgi:hypothetical protein
MGYDEGKGSGAGFVGGSDWPTCWSWTHRVRSAALALVATAVGFGGITAVSAGSEGCPNVASRSGASEHLPDCRAYEQVSPIDKNGNDAISLSSGYLRSAQASPTGNAFAYQSLVGSFSNSPANELFNAYVSSNVNAEWQTHGITPPTPQATDPIPTGVGYDFSDDLSQVMIRVEGQELTPGAPAGVYNLYLRHPAGNYSLITSVPPLVSQANCFNCYQSTDLSGFAGASSNYEKVIFESNEALATGAPTGGIESLYENVGGKIRLVGVLPDAVAAPNGSTAGAGSSDNGSLCPFCSQNIAHAISQDGSRIVFQAVSDGGAPAPNQSGLTELYDRVAGESEGSLETEGSSTLELSEPASGASPANTTPEEAKFWAATGDGSRVFFTSSAELTNGANTGAGNEGNDLYEAEVATSGGVTRRSALRDLTADTTEPNGGHVLGVVGTSEDGSYVYFVAEGELMPGNGTSGQPNLYVYHEGTDRFIATLNESDSNDWTSTPAQSRAYVTPDGRHLAFVSLNDLTGYDNQDVNTGEADSEVYEYSAEANRLVCGSCSPSNAPAQGNSFIGASFNELMSTPFHQPRTLSDDGSRLFFSSGEDLAPGASGEATKVYEYENGGVALISDGVNSSNDFFLDASANGDDVFIATRERLVPGDEDDFADVYDAQVNGNVSSTKSASPCVGSGCQEAPSQVPSFGPPASSTFVGSGNLAPSSSKVNTKPKPKVLTRAQKLAIALKACKRKPRGERAGCKQRANKRYRNKPKSSKSSRRGK